jgi:anaerobic selenocysteine-containing dehydrogenase
MGRQGFFQAVLAPLMGAFGVDMERLKQGPFRIPGEEIPWRDGRFATPSGKFELYSPSARADGQPPLPSFIPPEPAPAEYPMRLITPHAGDSLHSQHFAFVEGPPVLHLNPETMAEAELAEGEMARIATVKGSLRVRVRGHGGLDRSTAMIYEGWWHKNGAVNHLVGDDLSEMGEQAAYYETFCRVETGPGSSDGDPSPTGFQGVP